MPCNTVHIIMRNVFNSGVSYVRSSSDLKLENIYWSSRALSETTVHFVNRHGSGIMQFNGVAGCGQPVRETDKCTVRIMWFNNSWSEMGFCPCYVIFFMTSTGHRFVRNDICVSRLVQRTLFTLILFCTLLFLFFNTFQTSFRRVSCHFFCSSRSTFISRRRRFTRKPLLTRARTQHYNNPSPPANDAAHQWISIRVFLRPETK